MGNYVFKMRGRTKSIKREGLVLHIDLHTHTNYSDGILSPEQLVKKACDCKIRYLGVSDHDTIKGIMSAIKTSENLDAEMHIFPAIEISCKNDIHILGYFSRSLENWNHLLLHNFLKNLQEQRNIRNLKILEKLRELDFNIDIKDVKKYANGTVGKPHFAMAMVEKGYVASIEEAMDKYLKRGGSAYVERESYIDPINVVEMLTSISAVPVIAHPGYYKSVVDDYKKFFTLLKAHGLKGVEAFYAKATDEQSRYFVQIAEELGLIVTGGSDFHGYPKQELGNLYVPARSVDDLNRLIRKEDKKRKA